MSSQATRRGDDKPGPDVHVEYIRDLSRLQERDERAPHLVVTLESGRAGRLDLSDHRSAVWADVLESQHRSGQPIYIRIDQQTGFIAELLLPIRYRVQAVTPVPDGLDVQLDVSQAVHRVRSSNPDFEALRRSLEAALHLGAPILVTEALDDRGILDARPPVRQAGTPA